MPNLTSKKYQYIKFPFFPGCRSCQSQVGWVHESCAGTLTSGTLAHETRVSGRGIYGCMWVVAEGLGRGPCTRGCGLLRAAGFVSILNRALCSPPAMGSWVGLTPALPTPVLQAPAGVSGAWEAAELEQWCLAGASCLTQWQGGRPWLQPTRVSAFLPCDSSSGP
jgi:hypothetical protein